MSRKQGDPKFLRSHTTHRVQEILQNASTALEVATDLAPLIPVPVLGSVFIAAKCIVDASVKIRQDRRACAELAEYAANLTCHVHKTIRGNENMIDKDLSLSLTQLSSVLEEVRNYMEYQVSLGLWRRLCRRSGISDTLARYKSRLDYTMQTFTTTSNIRLELGFRYLKDGMDELRVASQNSQIFDGQYRIYRWGEIEIIRPHETSLDLFYSSDIEIYDAKIEGDVKVVKIYRDRQAFEHSRLVLKLARDCPKIPFAQLEGYAKDLSSPFLVLKGGLTNMFEYLTELNNADYFIKRLGFRAMLFLASHGLRWKGWVERLMISASGRLALGYSDDIAPRLDTDTDLGTTRVLISWPKLGVAEGLHILVEREDDVLLSLYSALQNTVVHRSLSSMADLWGRYIDELSCGITSFVSVTNLQPPLLGSIGCFRLQEDGLQLAVLENPFKGTVNVRTTTRLRPWTEDDESSDDFHLHGENNIVGESISIPFRVNRDKVSLHTTRTSFVHLSDHGWAAELLMESGCKLPHVDLESLVIVTGIIERATVLFSDGFSASVEPVLTRPSSIYYHVRPPDERGFLQKPCSYLAKTEDALYTDASALVQGVPDLETPQVPPNTFELNLDGVAAHLEQTFEVSCFQFSLTEAAAIKEMYNAISTS
ncbi:hypothetical protein M0805_003621 [Coniferiporia weirii]|nr:hypothetical protein M0805_003621 [Coniferiporia weirii]